MYNNLTFLVTTVNRAILLIHLTFWTFSVGSCTKAFPKVEVYVWAKNEETHMKMGKMRYHGNCHSF